jgi:DNA replication and repair protein RecF
MLSRLSARTFRNLEPLDLALAPGRHLLLGGNGAGKTSLLEAAYALATTKSFRTSRIADCARHGAGGFHLGGEVEAEARVALEVGWRETPAGLEGPGGGERLRLVNGRAAPLAEHLAVLPVVAWVASEAEVATGAPALRRRFLDRGVVGSRPAALAALQRYREALRGKRELLAGGRATAAELATWNTLLADAGAEVARLRAAYAAALSGAVAAVAAEAALPFPAIALGYRPSPPDADAGAAAILARLERRADEERRRGLALVGPHRDELAILWGGHPVRGTVSAGERKALSLLLTAGHARVLAAAGRAPLHLLDDLDAELAPDTLARLWAVFAGAPQLLATSNRPAVWQELAVDHRWQVRGGSIAAA